jgi:exopolysaccharide production protein ExoQ
MAPSLSLLFYFVLVVVLIVIERKWEKKSLTTLWIPTIWILLSGSRFLSQWMDPHESGGNIEEGSFLDRAVFSALILSAVVILMKYRVSWMRIVRQNIFLVIFIGYAGMSIIWSDFPFVSFKRWIKEVGNLIMVIVVLSEDPRGEKSITVLRRFSYILVPLSIVLIKYFPEYGRGYDKWSGQAFYHGVGLNKNYLGFLCLTTGIFFVWSLLTLLRRRKTAPGVRVQIVTHIAFLAMILWLFDKANSATSLICFITGAFVLFLLGFRVIKDRIEYLGKFLAISALIVLLLQGSMNLYDQVVAGLGRDSTLTDRTVLWEYIVGIETNPLFGCGYGSFFLGSRAEKLREIWWWQPNSTHNGYLDTYVNLGWIGVFLLISVIVSAYVKAKNQFISNFDYSRYSLTWLWVILLYNYTETAFSGVNLIWFIFLFFAVDLSGAVRERNFKT